MNIFERLFCEKKLQDVSDEAIDEELRRRKEVRRKQNTEIIHRNVKHCLQYLEDCDSTFEYASASGGSIFVKYTSDVSWDTIDGMLTKDVK